MNSSAAGQKAAAYARDCATSQKGDYYELSALMCWDAVVNCAVKTGAIPLKLDISATQFESFVSLEDPLVTNAIEMRRVPQGSFLGFIETGATPKLIHAMMATGQGLAAGNKNACIGIGGPVGWELLDLAGKLRWTSGGVNALPSGAPGSRIVQVRYRVI